MAEHSRQNARAEDALRYHEKPTAGKIEVRPTKPLSTQYDLSLAYSPGVAEPCRAIVRDPDLAYRYTTKGNLIAVVSNGTAVLGLGNIGPMASKPVMEGKGVLFKRFAGIDVFDLEIDADSPDDFIDTVARLEPGFGGFNLEDIKAPECFEIESRLRERCTVPVMHDDQHGTAIISGAALINAAELSGRKLEEMKMVLLGGGAAGIATARFYTTLGLPREAITVVDKDGVVRSGERDPANPITEFATDRPVRSLREALTGADILVGLSAGNIVDEDDLAVMADHPILFVLANPDPEITYDRARVARPDAIIATGRSDHPNQVNNVLGFPYIFRGALDVGATSINEDMKIAATRALAQLAREPVPEGVARAYSDSGLSFGLDYLIPKPLDPRLLTRVAPAVARAAMDSGVARYTIDDWDYYEAELLERVGIGQKLITGIISRARRDLRRIVLGEADDYNVLKAAQLVHDQGIAEPVLLGDRAVIESMIQEHNLQSLTGSRIISPRDGGETVERYAQLLYRKRQRRGVTYKDALRLTADRNYYGALMVEAGDADGFVSGRTRQYPRIIRPALEVIGMEPSVNRVAGTYVVQTHRGVYFFADTTVNLEPTAEQLAEIVGLTARTVRYFNIEPVVAVISHSNFGSTKSEESERCKRAVAISRERFPDLLIDGEVQANIALDQSLLRELYPFSILAEHRANTLIFPNLTAGNVAYKLLGEIGNAELIGPVLMGMQKPVQVLQLGSTVREIVNMIAFAATESQQKSGIREDKSEQ
jgi:malate dehydrogenase (oxaloacetate-decarboxylating)(NADP+)